MYRIQLVMRAIQIIGQIVEIMCSESECCYNVVFFLVQIQHQGHDFIVNINFLLFITKMKQNGLHYTFLIQ